jgi:hypothetical protein
LFWSWTIYNKNYFLTNIFFSDSSRWFCVIIDFSSFCNWFSPRARTAKLRNHRSSPRALLLSKNIVLEIQPPKSPLHRVLFCFLHYTHLAFLQLLSCSNALNFRTFRGMFCRTVFNYYFLVIALNHLKILHDCVLVRIDDEVRRSETK